MVLIYIFLIIASKQNVCEVKKIEVAVIADVFKHKRMPETFMDKDSFEKNSFQ